MSDTITRTDSTTRVVVDIEEAHTKVALASLANLTMAKAPPIGLYQKSTNMRPSAANAETVSLSTKPVLFVIDGSFRS